MFRTNLFIIFIFISNLCLFGQNNNSLFFNLDGGKSLKKHPFSPKAIEIWSNYLEVESGYSTLISKRVRLKESLDFLIIKNPLNRNNNSKISVPIFINSKIEYKVFKKRNVFYELSLSLAINKEYLNLYELSKIKRVYFKNQFLLCPIKNNKNLLIGFEFDLTPYFFKNYERGFSDSFYKKGITIEYQVPLIKKKNKEVVL